MSATSALLTETYQGHSPPQTVWEEAASLFSSHYGTWGPLAEHNYGSFAKTGRRVRMSAAKLRDQCWPEKAQENVFVRALVGGAAVGHVFASRWSYRGRTVCWISQLVVHSDFRERRIASTLLAGLRRPSDDAFGICSSHPAAITAAARALGVRYQGLDFTAAKAHAAAVMQSAPIRYVHNASPSGRLFDPTAVEGSFCCANVGFWVDHDEPLRALNRLSAEWKFGSLPEGHEFLLFLTFVDSF
ncbi:hypothetical protein FH972_023640 [Carpinus fangiana]|uniref:N-acetyltransferase domain-containing protein n=1 Tax=Carpinus fangiana TaxID=176857 RepID=A0A5N6KY12_9ROSI|nr:hypothetical protein FH972_023640 [Carpinus fangiana]